ncbi:Sec-independent protein translocase subunit TatA [Promicromonospora sp. NPDC057138]|uniref:Sec-independent protein translocase subunit TatA n=1 Tax=Promicromonospora sp. NPDC057138 TaxID=3346031 RepID=UPI0036443042
MTGALQPWHWIVLIAIVLLLFGSSRLPGLAKSVGQSMKIFKKEVNELREDKSGNAADNAPGGSTTSSPSSTAGPGAGSGTDSVPGLISNKDRDIPKA